MSNTNRIVLWLLGIALLGGVAWYTYWFLTNFEQDTKEVRTGISPQARKNRFLAAEMFLKQNGLSVTSHAGSNIFALSLSKEDTIILGSHSQLFLQHNSDKLLAWINSGGHLIFVPQHTGKDEKKSSLLQQLGVKLRSVYEDKKPGSTCKEGDKSCEGDTPSGTNKPDKKSKPAPGKHEKNNRTDDRKMVTVTFHTDHPGDFHARFLADRYLQDTNDTAAFALGNDDHFNLLDYSLGNGTVTVLSDLNLFTNTDVGKDDHAYLLYQLAAGPGKIWIFYSADMPSLLALLWKNAPYLVLLSAVLLLMMGWYMLARSGPKRMPKYEPRRNLLEHIDATAIYSWRIDKARHLFSDNRKALEQAWRRRHPQLGDMSQTERSEWIGEKTGITASAIERTLYGDIESEQDFIRASAVMQQLAAKIDQHSGA